MFNTATSFFFFYFLCVNIEEDHDIHVPNYLSNEETFFPLLLERILFIFVHSTQHLSAVFHIFSPNCCLISLKSLSTVHIISRATFDKQDFNTSCATPTVGLPLLKSLNKVLGSPWCSQWLVAFSSVLDANLHSCFLDCADPVYQFIHFTGLKSILHVVLWTHFAS